jgi:hypothetical protein
LRTIENNRASGRRLIHLAMGSHAQGNFSAAKTLYAEACGVFMLAGDDAGVAEATSGKMQCAIDEFEASVYSRTLDAVSMALAAVDSAADDDKWQEVDCELEGVLVEEKPPPGGDIDLDAAIDLPPVVRATCFIDAPAAVVMGDVWPSSNIQKWESRVTEVSVLQAIDSNLEIVRTVKNVGFSMDFREFQTARHRTSDGNRKIFVEFSVERPNLPLSQDNRNSEFVSGILYLLAVVIEPVDSSTSKVTVVIQEDLGGASEGLSWFKRALPGSSTPPAAACLRALQLLRNALQPDRIAKQLESGAQSCLDLHRFSEAVDMFAKAKVAYSSIPGMEAKAGLCEQLEHHTRLKVQEIEQSRIDVDLLVAEAKQCLAAGQVDDAVASFQSAYDIAYTTYDDQLISRTQLLRKDAELKKVAHDKKH